jgi:hypothetical protein
MKNYKILFAFILVGNVLCGCGVKNDLEKPNPDFPRVYPVK